MATSPITKPLENIETKHIRIIGVPLDLGQSRRGVDMGPSAMRVAGLEAKLEALGYDVKDVGNVPVALAETKSEGDPHAKYLKEITDTCSKEADLVVKTLESGAIPVVLGGDHSIACGTVSGVAEFYRRKNQRIGLLWIDAHTDINTPDSSPSGNVHGMPLGAIMGLFPFAADRPLRIQPQSAAGKLRAGRHSRRGQLMSARTSASRACMSSPCATSTSAACAP